jgi:hypothetical protein
VIRVDATRHDLYKVGNRAYMYNGLDVRFIPLGHRVELQGMIDKGTAKIAIRNMPDDSIRWCAYMQVRPVPSALVEYRKRVRNGRVRVVATSRKVL